MRFCNENQMQLDVTKSAKVLLRWMYTNAALVNFTGKSKVQQRAKSLSETDATKKNKARPPM